MSDKEEMDGYSSENNKRKGDSKEQGYIQNQ